MRVRITDKHAVYKRQRCAVKLRLPPDIPVDGFDRNDIVKFRPCAAVIDSPDVTFVLFAVFVIGALSFVCVGAVEVVLLLVLDVHPATTTVKDSSAITRPAMTTRFFSIISPLQCVLYMLMGVKHAHLHTIPSRRRRTQNVPPYTRTARFCKWRGSNGSGQRHNSVEGLSLTI